MSLYPLGHPASPAHSKAHRHCCVYFTASSSYKSLILCPASLPSGSSGWTSTLTQLWLHKHSGFEPLGMADLGG